jgi:hypothetical protein
MVNAKLGIMWKKAVTANFKTLFRHLLPGDTGEDHKKPQPGQLMTREDMNVATLGHKSRDISAAIARRLRAGHPRNLSSISGVRKIFSLLF